MGNEDIRLRYEQAVVLFRNGRYHEALAAFERLSHKRPTSKRILYHRALCHLALGDVDAARRFHDELSGLRDDSAHKLAALLRRRIRAAGGAASGDKTPSGHTPDIEGSRADWAGLLRSRLAYVGLGACAMAALAVAGAVLMTPGKDSRTAARPPTRPAFDAAECSPDMTVEPAAFYLAGSNAPYRMVTLFGCVDRRDDDAPSAPAEHIGSRAAENWGELRPKLERAFSMMASFDDPMPGIPPEQQAWTLAVPRHDVPLTGSFEGKQVEVFVPGQSTTLESLASACGPPVREETWRSASQRIGAAGTTYWWGNIGIATDEGGSVTHILLRGGPVARRVKPLAAS